MRSVLSRRARPGPLGVALAATTLAAGALVPLAGTAHAAVACSVTYTTNQWPGGFTANVTLRNEGDALAGWRLTWTFLDGQRIQQSWSSRYSQSGSAVTITNEAWNGNVASGASVAFGFNASWSGQNRPPTDFAVNGTPAPGPTGRRRCRSPRPPTAPATPSARRSPSRRRRPTRTAPSTGSSSTTAPR
ncbi:cellulose binding domain-containing protein [Actinokineospora soli]|uniref:Cellulose binding domain-containing protein n=1 Tax=Actinokineospora soli TaxID=1048753 RepID=A0ABW2TSR3_9PSEU